MFVANARLPRPRPRPPGPRCHLSLPPPAPTHAQETNGLDFQAFLDLLQRAGEERALMDLSDEELDDWVPLEVLRDFARHVAAGMARLLGDICPPAEISFADL